MQTTCLAILDKAKVDTPVRHAMAQTATGLVFFHNANKPTTPHIQRITWAWE